MRNRRKTQAMGVKFGLDVEKGSEETLKEDVREGWELGVGRRRGGERTVSVKCKEESEGGEFNEAV